MGVTTSGGFKRSGDNAKRNAQFATCVAGAMDRAMKFGATVGQDTIENTGTGYQGRRGRVDTGVMRDDFSGEVTERDEKRVVGTLGWLQSEPFYAKFQEHGFTHYLTGKHVEGMFALRDAGEQAWDEFRKDANACVKEAYGK